MNEQEAVGYSVYVGIDWADSMGWCLVTDTWIIMVGLKDFY
ncbi:MAG: hypothetical protein ACYTBY_05470 [Planctomycetota bacterium]|jgi:roadblock/LC7 domain-containing protein